MELVDVVVYALIHHLDAAVYKHLPLELARLVNAGQPLQLADEGVAFLLGDKPGGLHRVHEQLHLGQLEIPLPHEPAGGSPLPGLDIQPKQTQGLQVVVDALALRLDVRPGQPLDDLGHGEGVVLIGLPQQHAVQMEQLSLLIGGFCHGNVLLSKFHSPV